MVIGPIRSLLALPPAETQTPRILEALGGAPHSPAAQPKGLYVGTPVLDPISLVVIAAAFFRSRHGLTPDPRDSLLA